MSLVSYTGTKIEAERVMDKDGTAHTLRHWYSFRFKLVIEGVLIGLACGLIVSAYRYALEQAFHLLGLVRETIIGKPESVVVWIGALILCGLVIGELVKRNPLISGSGIPQIEGFLSGRLEMSWWRILLAKFAGGVLAIGSGLSLGREGPSVQLGAAVGLGFSRVAGRTRVEERFLVTGGAGAGLAAAFNAPLAGVVFALEELHKNFSPFVLITALSSALTASYVSGFFFGLKPVFSFPQLAALPAEHYVFVLLLGLALGLLGVLFNSSLFKSQDLYARTGLSPRFRSFIPLALSVPFLFYLPEVLGGGHELVVDLIGSSFAPIFLFALLAGKFVFTMICYGSGAPGGIFLPLLSLGALVGALWARVIAVPAGVDPEFLDNFIVLGMAGLFSAIVRAPITGIILITEMTGSFQHLLSISLVSITAYVSADLMRSPPVYEALLERLLRFRGSCREEGFKPHEKTVFELAVSPGSGLDGVRIQDVAWPGHSLIVAVRRGQSEIIPHGETGIEAGDYLVMLTDCFHLGSVNEACAALLEPSG